MFVVGNRCDLGFRAVVVARRVRVRVVLSFRGFGCGVGFVYVLGVFRS